MQNKITLNFDPNIVLLAGFEYGKQTFEKQAEGYLDINESFCIEFPNTVEAVASSFVQGFFGKMKQTIGLKNIKNRITIICKNESLSESIIEKLY